MVYASLFLLSDYKRVVFMLGINLKIKLKGSKAITITMMYSNSVPSKQQLLGSIAIVFITSLI